MDAPPRPANPILDLRCARPWRETLLPSSKPERIPGTNWRTLFIPHLGHLCQGETRNQFITPLGNPSDVTCIILIQFHSIEIYRPQGWQLGPPWLARRHSHDRRNTMLRVGRGARGIAGVHRRRAQKKRIAMTAIASDFPGFPDRRGDSPLCDPLT